MSVLPNDLKLLNDEILVAIRKRIPKLEVVSKVHENYICLEMNQSIIDIDPFNNIIVIGGRYAEPSVAIGKRMDVHFSHWSRERSATLLKFADERPHFKDRIETFLIVLGLFPDLELGKYFLDKEIVAKLRRSNYHVDAYITKGKCLLVVKCRCSKTENTLTFEIKENNIMDKIKDPKTAEDAIGGVAENVIAQEKEKIKKSQAGAEQKPQAVYGDSVEGEV